MLSYRLWVTYLLSFIPMIEKTSYRLYLLYDDDDDDDDELQ